MLKEKVIFEDNENNDQSNEAEYDMMTDSEYIAAAMNAITAVDMIDTGILSHEDRDKIEKIKIQSIRIISECLNTLYNEIFDDTANSNNDLVL
ncbi:MAG: hypothetical protein EBR82_55585 [Caulobacteraceae bacterium]|nr:hypothetical protein [Caulobacteraceae bacterium]